MRRKKLLWAVVVSTLLVAAAAGDEIHFNIATGGTGSLTASPSGLSFGPANLITVTDVTTSVTLPLLGSLTGSAGAASAFTTTSNTVAATYSAGGADSVSLLDTASSPLVQGMTQDGGVFAATFPDGGATFLGQFTPSFLNPTVLAMFGLTGQTVLPDGNVSLTFVSTNFDMATMTVTGRVDSATVTVFTSALPEPTGITLMGAGLLTIAGVVNRRRIPLTALYKIRKPNL